MPVKLLLRWNINPRTETEYYDFIINEFLPRLQRLGLYNVQMWYTTFGKPEQIQADGMIQSLDLMQVVLRSDEWRDLETRLKDYITHYQRKVINASDSFQI